MGACWKATSIMVLVLASGPRASAQDVTLHAQYDVASASPPDATDPTPTVSHRHYTSGTPGPYDVDVPARGSAGGS